MGERCLPAAMGRLGDSPLLCRQKVRPGDWMSRVGKNHTPRSKKEICCSLFLLV